MRVAISAVLIIAGLGLVGVAFAGSDGLRRPVEKLTIAAIDVHAYPAYATGKDVPAPKPPETKAPETKAPETKPPEVARPAEPAEVAKPPEAKPAVKPAEVKTAEPKPAAAVKTAEPKAAEPKPAAVAGSARPPPAAAEKKPAAPAAAEAPPAGSGDGILNLSASDTADVFVDGRKAGTSPLLGYKVKAGKHKVRFDCYDATGSTTRGPEVVLEVRAMEEKDKDFECTAEAKAPAPKPASEDLP